MEGYCSEDWKKRALQGQHSEGMLLERMEVVTLENLVKRETLKAIRAGEEKH